MKTENVTRVDIPKSDRVQCSRIVYRPNNASSLCACIAVCRVDGSAFCTSHDPVRIKAKRDASLDAWREKSRREAAMNRVDACGRALIAAILARRSEGVLREELFAAQRDLEALRRLAPTPKEGT